MSAHSRESLAFRVYLELGPVRSLDRLHRRLREDPEGYGFRKAPSLRTLEAWSAKYHWTERVREIERKAREEEEQELVQRVREYRERLRKEGLLLQQRGLAWLTAKDADDVRASDAIRAIGEGFRIEALGLGDVTERIEIQEEERHGFENLSNDELAQLVRSLSTAAGPGALGDVPPQP